jgi:hypothetical protein
MYWPVILLISIADIFQQWQNNRKVFEERAKVSMVNFKKDPNPMHLLILTE